MNTIVIISFLAIAYACWLYARHRTDEAMFVTALAIWLLLACALILPAQTPPSAPNPAPVRVVVA